MYPSRLGIVSTGQPITPSLSVTSSDVTTNYNNLLLQVKNPQIAQALADLKKDQDDAERQLVLRTNSCSIPVLSALRERMGGLQAAQLKEYTAKHFHNPDVMKVAMCTADSIFYTSPFDVGSLYLNNRIRLYIHNLRQVGSESVEGYSLVADFENAKDMFVVKVARTPFTDTLLHELVVGMYGTNILRQHIPNFVYVYGGFKCSPPLVDPETKKVVTWCLHDSNSVNYVLYENVTTRSGCTGTCDPLTMSQYIQTCTGREFLNVYMQVLYALRLALKLIDFTHYDLTSDNVILRDPFLAVQGTPVARKNFQIAYETERGVEYITTQTVPTIIDYGHAHIRTGTILDSTGKIVVQAQDYGRSGLIPFSVYPYRSWIMHDLYKFLMFCIMNASRHNNQGVLTEAIKIFRFFNQTEDPVAALNAQADTFFSLPLTETTNSLSIHDLVVYIRTVCHCDFIAATRSADPILDCEKVCITGKEVLTKIGMNLTGPIGVPDNIIEFYDIAVRLQNEQREAEKIKMAASFPYRPAMQAHINIMREMIRDLIFLRQGLKLVDVAHLTIDQLLQYNTMVLVRSMYVTVGAIIDKTATLLFYNDIGQAVARSYGDDNALASIKDNMIVFNRDVRTGLEDAERILERNHSYLDRVGNEAVVATAVARDARLRWY